MNYFNLAGGNALATYDNIFSDLRDGKDPISCLHTEILNVMDERIATMPAGPIKLRGVNVDDQRCAGRFLGSDTGFHR